MSFTDVQNKTAISTSFSAADRATILAAMRTAYEGSATARVMFDSWVSSKTITIDFLPGQFRAHRNAGKLEIDLNGLAQGMYIDNNGTAVQDTAVTAIVHELVHALTGRSDNQDLILSGATNDYRQPTVTFSNIIYSELGLPEQNSYIGTNVDGNLTLNFQYTKGAAIDRSVSLDRDWDSSRSGNFKDLLIGGASNNTLRAGDGDDFLYGNRGRDTLDGGNDNDMLDGGLDKDTLKGGAGVDIYIVGEGSDTIIDDSAGQGSVKTKTGYIFTGGEKEGSNSWKSRDGQVSYVQSGSNLIIVKGDDAANRTTIENFDFDMAKNATYLGISLKDKNENKNKQAEIYPLSEQVLYKTLLAINWVWPSDPLVLDLDGDGVDLTDSNSAVLFDHNADNVKTGTQWVKSDDGMLVRDINGNGTIDSGRELFGDQTRLPNGQLAANGFQALSALDSNADGVIDANDAAYADLRVWRDLNQDGTSQAGELQTLGEAGITSINLAANAQGVGSFVKTTTAPNGTTTSTTQVVKNVNLAINNFYSEFTDNPVVTDAIAALPQIRGAGQVRDLQEAMSLGSVQSQALEQTITTFKAANTAQARQALLGAVVDSWANTSAMGDARARNPIPANAASWYVSSPGQAIANFATQQPALYQQLSTLERFNGQPLIERYTRAVNSYYYDPAIGGYRGYTYYTVGIEAQRLPFFQSAYDSLTASVYQNLYQQTTGQDLMNQVEVIIDDKGLRLDFSAVDVAFDQKTAADAAQAAVDLTEFFHFTIGSLSNSGWDGAVRLGSLLETAIFTPEQHAILQGFKLKQAADAGSILNGAGDVDILVGKAGNDTLAGSGGADVLIGGAGNDTLIGGQGNDQLVGGLGNDYLDGQWGSDSYFWGAGQGHDSINDIYADANGKNLVVLRGLNPQDVRTEQFGIDDYTGVRLTIIATGETLTIRNSNYSSWDWSTISAPMTLMFADGTQWDMKEAIRQSLPMPTDGNDVLIGSDYDDLPSRLSGGAGDDIIVGRGGADVMEGGAGNDILYGNASRSSILNGQIVPPYWRLGTYSSSDSDVFVFGRGDGQDTIIHENYTDKADADVLRFKEGVAPEDLELVQRGYDLVVAIKGTDDRITVKRFFFDIENRLALAPAPSIVGKFEFADGTEWNLAQIYASAWGGTAQDDVFVGDRGGNQMSGGDGNDALNGLFGNDSLHGGNGDDVLDGSYGSDLLEGGAGNDTLMGGADDDVLDGGAGDDMLYAGLGADTIRFGRGDGHDTLAADRSWDRYYQRLYNNQPHLASGNNTVELKAGVGPDDIKLMRNGADLVISIKGTTDTLTVKAFIEDVYAPDAETRQFNLLEIRFADGSSWGAQEVLARTLIGDATDEKLTGLFDAEIFDGGGGNDELIGGGGNGGDTYLFGRGDGKDTVRGDLNYNTDILKFNAGVSEQDVQVRRVGDAAVFTILDTGESITFTSGFITYGSQPGIQVLSSVQFADGTTWSREQINERAIQGTSGDDLIADVVSYGYSELHGGAGNDTLMGTRGTNLYTFGRGDGRDTIIESYTSSNDAIRFDDGILAGDLVVSIQGDDLVIGISGSTDQITIKGDRGGRIEIFEVGGVALSYAQILSLIESEGSETLLGTSGDDVLSGTAKISEIYGFDGNDTLSGGAGDDLLDGGVDNDALQGNDGSDALYGGDGNDVLEGGAGNDALNGGEGDDILDGGTGRDFLAGGAGNNIYRYERGGELDDIALDTLSSSTIELGSGISLADVTVQTQSEYNYDTNEWVISGLVIGFGGNDALYVRPSAEAGLDPAFAQSLTVRLADGTTLAYADLIGMSDAGVIGYRNVFQSDMNLLGSQADDTVDAYGSNIYIDGRDNNDVLRVNGSNGLVYGGAGDDDIRISGGGVAVGGKGNDLLAANYGAKSTFAFNAGDGKDRIDNYFAHGTLSFGAGITADNVRLWVDSANGDLVFSIGSDGNDEVRTSWYDAERAVALGSHTLEVVQFIDAGGAVRQYDIRKLMADAQSNVAGLASAANGLVLQEASDFLFTRAQPVLGGTAAIAYAQTGDLKGAYTIAANADLSTNNLLFGTPDSDVLDGAGGNDVVMGGGADDLLWGGEGDDYLDGQAGNDRLDGGLGDDILVGGRGNDTLIGGTGNNEAYGGSGSDSYAYTRGDGLLYIEDFDVDGEEDSGGEGGYGGYGGSGGGSYVDELVFGPGITLADLSFSRSGNNLVVTVAGGAGDVITLAGFDENRASGNRSIERFVFQAGDVLELNDVWNSTEVSVVTNGDGHIEGTELNDEVRGGLQADELLGGEGNDRLVGGRGDDAYLIDDYDGDDVIVDSALDANLVVFTGSVTADELSLSVEGGISTIRFRDSSIVLEGWDGTAASSAPISQFVFSDGSALSMVELFSRPRGIWGTEQADVLNGAAGADDIHGLEGNDLMQGGAGSDIYYLEENSGQDTITDLSVLGQENTLVFADVTDPETIRLTLNAAGQLVILLEGGNSVTLTNFNRLTPQGERTIDFFQFGFSGTVLTYDELLQRGFVIDGTEGSDLLRGTALHDVFTGGAGNDSFERSTGDDVLSGGQGDDSYEYNIGDGLVTINDIADASGGNVLRFGAGISPADVERKLRFYEDPNDPAANRFLIVFDGDNEISISGFDRENPAASAHGIENFVFADGTVLNWNDLLDKIFVVEGDDLDNAIKGTSRSDRLYGYGGIDVLQGGAGDDVLTGGTDSDHLDGGSGQDNYVFNLGDGQDTVVDQDANNTISFGEGIDAQDISVVRNGNGFTVSYGNGGDSIYFNSVDGTAPPISNFQLADGTLLAFSDFINRAPEVGETLANQAGRVGSAFSFSLDENAFSDPDGDTLRWAVQLSGDQPLPAWLQFDPVTRTLSGTPPAGTQGSYQVQVFASDTHGVAMSQVFTLDVAPNAAPELVNDTAAATEDATTPLSGNVLANDTETDGPDALQVVSAGVYQGAFGALTLAADGSYTYVLNNALAGVQKLKAGEQVVDAFTYVAGDGMNNVAAQLLVTVTGTNDAPTVGTVIAGQAATQGQLFSMNLPTHAFMDVDAGDSLSYSAALADGSPLPSWLSVNAATGALTGVPANGDVGVLAVKLTATDTAGAAATTSFSLTVGNVNDAPVASLPITAQAALEDAAFSFTVPAGSFVDIDAGDSLAYTAQLANGDPLPSWLVFDSATRTFSGTPLNANVGTLSLRVTATDVAGAAASSVFNVTVGNTNDAPTVSAGAADQAATQDQPFSFTLAANTFSDEDAGDSLSYTASLASGGALPSWLHFDAATRTFSGTPGNSDVGQLAIVVTATDASGASVSDSFDVTVGNVNDAPIVVRAIDGQAAAQNQPFSFTLPVNTFTDIDAGDVLVLSATLANGDPLPGWLSFDAATGTFSGTPANGDVGALNVRVAARDAAGASASSVFALAISNVNDAPVLVQPLADALATEDAAFSYTLPAGAFTDIDAADHLTYAATLANGDSLPAWLSFNAATGTFSGTPANANVGSVNVRVTATDGSGAQASDVFSIAVTNTNDAPVVVQAIANGMALEDQAFSFTIPTATFTDVDGGDTLVYTAKLANGNPLPSWLSFNAATGTFSGTPANSDVGGLSITVTATDGQGAAASSTFTLGVANTNDAPTLANAIADQVAAEDTAFAFTLPGNTFADVDAGDSRSYTATLANGSPLPAWLSFNAVTGTFSGTPANGNVGTVSILVTATDGSGASASDVFNLNVSNTNDAPVAGNDLGSAAEDGGPVTLTAAALLGNDSDVDAGDSKRISAVAASSAAGAAVTLVNGNVVYNPGNLFQSLAQGATRTDTFSYTMSDSAGASSTATVTMTITGTNDAPVLALQTAAQTATRGTAFTLTLPAGTFSDVDTGDSLGWSASLANGSPLPAWLVFNAATRTFSGTPGSGDVGALTLRVTATDQAGASATESFALTVQGGNTQGQTFIGTSGNDVLNGTPYDDILDGRAGNDVLNGGAGSDIITGGTGSDRLSGEAGNDTLGFTADATWNGSYRAIHNGSPGNAGTCEQVSLSGKNRSYDIFNGGAGQDALVGTNGHDALFLDDSYSPPDGYTGPRIQQIELISMEGGNDLVDLTSSRYAYGDVTLDGGTGNDVLWASSGNDQLLGGDGNDQLDGGAGNDILDGGSGNDELRGGVGQDILGGGAGNDSLEAGAGDDVLDGGTGNDDLAGGLGNDIYVHGLNGGADVIQEQGGQDVIRFAAGITANAVNVSRHHNDLVLNLGGQNGSVTVEGWFNGGAASVERVEFADGTVWSESALRALSGENSGGGSGGGCDSGGNNGNHYGRNDNGSSNGRDEPSDKKKVENDHRLEDAVNQINDRLAAAPRHDFGSLAAYLSQQGGSSTGPLTATQIARQWSTVSGSIQRLGQDDDGARQGVQGGSFGSGDDLVHGAMSWGYAGSVGQAGSAGGMTSLTGLAEGFKKLS